MIDWVTGDVFDGLAGLEDGSVDVIITSPPFLALRSYLPADHPDKSKEIGSEKTPAEFLDVMLRLSAEFRRVLAPHGSICVELGDTYAGSGGGGGGGDLIEGSGIPQPKKLAMAESLKVTRKLDNSWPLAKSKTLIPQLYEIALAYGFNPLTGVESPAGKWLVRNVVTWARPNPPVGALGISGVLQRLMWWWLVRRINGIGMTWRHDDHSRPRRLPSQMGCSRLPRTANRRP